MGAVLLLIVTILVLLFAALVGLGGMGIHPAMIAATIVPVVGLFFN